VMLFRCVHHEVLQFCSIESLRQELIRTAVDDLYPGPITSPIFGLNSDLTVSQAAAGEVRPAACLVWSAVAGE
jgi:hypothetical protein